MSRYLSASVEDTPFFKGDYNAKDAFPSRLLHAASAFELRGLARPVYTLPGPRSRKSLQYDLRAPSSAPLGDISYNVRRSTSKPESCCAIERCPSLDGSECVECFLEPKASKVLHFLPYSKTGEPVLISTDACVSCNIDPSDDFSFPLKPVPLSTHSAIAFTDDKRSPRTPSRRWPGAREYLTPPSTPDRYISDRYRPQEALKTFRVSKSPEQLSNSEKLLRHALATPDPFEPPVAPRLREPGSTTSTNGAARALRSRARIPGLTNVLALPQDTLALQNRQASIGAVWNVGGSALATHAGPIHSVSNGRDGFLSSGSNAPMYTSQFLDDGSLEYGFDRMESRIAAALDMDLTSRVLRNTRSFQSPRCVSTGSTGAKRKYPYIVPRTIWKHGEWTNDGSNSLLDAPHLRDDYYCTVLAYCRTANVLAVGLANKVYLWSETFGVQYAPGLNTSRETYVTSVSFSSNEGGHSILAIGQNSGQISLWSLYDQENVRFQSQQPCAVACVAFKPVTTRRSSERLGCMMATEELLVGDEVGNVYYYSVEWMNKQQVDIHDWMGSMTLMAKISVHTQQICGIAWSPDGDYFATGANDNACCLFNAKDILIPPHSAQDASTVYRGPFQTILGGFGLPNFIARAGASPELMGVMNNGTHMSRTRVIPGQDGSLLIGQGRQKHRWLHSAAVKAIAFCPWQRGLIATGGGSNDRAIHFYHTLSGACLATINVHTQVTSLIWSTTRREIAATFGYAQPDHPYRIAVFSWPECKQVVAIPWASDMRALYAIPYPGGPGETTTSTSMGETWYSRTKKEGCIVVASSDESVKFHEVWSGSGKSTETHTGLLGGSDILEGLEGIDKEGPEVIR